MFVAYHELYAHPLPEGHRFPMAKYELIPEQLIYEGTISSNDIYAPAILDEDIVLLAHEKDYWQQLKQLSLPLKEQRKIGFPLNSQLVERELRIARGTIDGTLWSLEHQIAFNIAGGTHHAGSNWGEGFCMLNDQAIAANYLIKNKLVNSILIIDLDVHQGNGTAEIFENEHRVFTFSMHGEKNFPFKKEKSDLDIPLQDGITDETYLSKLTEGLELVFKKQKPDFVFYLSGVDVLATDKLGKLSLSKAGCKKRDQLVFEACINHKVPVQVSMGGGYSPEINTIVDAHCNTFRVAKELYL